MATYTSMHHNSFAASMSSEAAASFCALVLLGSVVLTESIFVYIISIILCVVLMIPNKIAAAS